MKETARIRLQRGGPIGDYQFFRRICWDRSSLPNTHIHTWAHSCHAPSALFAFLSLTHTGLAHALQGIGPVSRAMGDVDTAVTTRGREVGRPPGTLSLDSLTRTGTPGSPFPTF